MSKGRTSARREFSPTHSITSDPRDRHTTRHVRGSRPAASPPLAWGCAILLDGKGWGETARWASPSPPPCTHDTFLTGLPSGAQVQRALHTFPAQHDHHIAVECRPDRTCLAGEQESRQVSLAEMGIAGVGPRIHHTWQPWVGVGGSVCTRHPSLDRQQHPEGTQWLPMVSTSHSHTVQMSPQPFWSSSHTARPSSVLLGHVLASLGL